MFTGIVQDVGRVVGLAGTAGGRRLSVATALDTSDFTPGESVAVNGVCLTVTGKARGRFDADVSPETLSRATLGEFRSGDPVNLERALRPLDRLGGHFVLGHVDAVGRLAQRSAEGGFQVLQFEAPAEVTRYLVEKGSVAVDGVSLTVARCDARGFAVAAIPHTLEQTNLARLRPGDRVNLEADILAKYVERLLGGRKAPEGLSLDTLARAGFLG